MQELPGIGDKVVPESPSQVLASPCKKKSMDQIVCCYLCDLISQQLCMDTVASSVTMTTRRGQHSGGVRFCVFRRASSVAPAVKPSLMRHGKCVHAVCHKDKSTRPTHEIPLSVCSVLMLVIIYFDIFGKNGGIYSKKKKKK